MGFTHGVRSARVMMMMIWSPQCARARRSAQSGRRDRYGLCVLWRAVRVEARIVQYNHESSDRMVVLDAVSRDERARRVRARGSRVAGLGRRGGVGQPAVWSVDRVGARRLSPERATARAHASLFFEAHSKKVGLLARFTHRLSIDSHTTNNSRWPYLYPRHHTVVDDPLHDPLPSPKLPWRLDVVALFRVKLGLRALPLLRPCLLTRQILLAPTLDAAAHA